MWVTVLSQDMQDVVIVDCIATMDVTVQVNSISKVNNAHDMMTKEILVEVVCGSFLGELHILQYLPFKKNITVLSLI